MCAGCAGSCGARAPKRCVCVCVCVCRVFRILLDARYEDLIVCVCVCCLVLSCLVAHGKMSGGFVGVCVLHI